MPGRGCGRSPITRRWSGTRPQGRTNGSRSCSSAWSRKALRRLGEDHRVALQETYLADRPYAEVAAELGIPESTLRSRVFYGLKALRVVMEEMEVVS